MAKSPKKGHSEENADPKALDPDALGKRLLKYARDRAGTGFRLGPPERVLEDVVIEALASLFVGERKWDPQKHPDPWQHLVGVVNSKIYNLRHSVQNDRFDRLEGDPPAVGNSPEAEMQESEEKKWRRRATDLVLGQIIQSEDQQLLRLYNLLEEDPMMERARLASALGLEPSQADQVTNLRKRLQRLLTKAVAQLQGELNPTADGGSHE